jgi:hypothetical protein
MIKRADRYHRIYGEALFQSNFYVFSLAKGLREEWAIYLRNLKESGVWYIGRVSDDGVNLFDAALMGETGLVVRRLIMQLKQKIAYRWAHQIEPCSDICYTH